MRPAFRTAIFAAALALPFAARAQTTPSADSASLRSDRRDLARARTRDARVDARLRDARADNRRVDAERPEDAADLRNSRRDERQGDAALRDARQDVRTVRASGDTAALRGERRELGAARRADQRNEAEVRRDRRDRGDLQQTRATDRRTDQRVDRLRRADRRTDRRVRRERADVRDDRGATMPTPR